MGQGTDGVGIVISDGVLVVIHEGRVAGVLVCFTFVIIEALLLRKQSTMKHHCCLV